MKTIINALSDASYMQNKIPKIHVKMQVVYEFLHHPVFLLRNLSTLRNKLFIKQGLY